MTDVMDDARRIKRGILDFIHTYGCEQAPEEAFGALARDVFIYQYTYDLPYRRYCAAKRVTPQRSRIGGRFRRCRWTGSSTLTFRPYRPSSAKPYS
jgi:hypothetical protein